MFESTTEKGILILLVDWTTLENIYFFVTFDMILSSAIPQTCWYPSTIQLLKLKQDWFAKKKILKCKALCDLTYSLNAKKPFYAPHSLL